MKKTKKFQFTLDNQLYEWIRSQAFKYNKTMGEFVRTVLLVEKQIEDNNE